MKQINRFGWLFAIIAFILLLMLFWYPQPSATGSGQLQCTTHTTQIDDIYYVDAEEVCGAGCLIDKITLGDIQGLPVATCKCCTCSGSGELVKPSCDTSPLSMLYKWLGACV